MTFVELYTTELDRELGSSQTTLFTTARRKAAINAAQLEFVKRTECLKRTMSIDLEDETSEYDVSDTAGDFGWLGKIGASIQITDSDDNVRYVQGEDLEETSIDRLNVERPGWRSFAASTPDRYYVDLEGGALNVGVTPAPSIDSGDSWVLSLPYIPIPTDLSSDDDEPFTVLNQPARRLRFWHRTLVHYAAYDLEKFRKDVQRGAAQLQLFEMEVQKYFAAMTPKTGSQVRLIRDYRASRRAVRRDPRV